VNRYGTYQGVRVEGASPLRLVLLSHEALYRSLGLARKAIQDGDADAEAAHTARAVESIVELATSLNLDEGGAIAASLASLYAYMMKRLGEGMCTGSTAAVDEVIGCVRTLREGWQALEESEAGKHPVRRAIAAA